MDHSRDGSWVNGGGGEVSPPSCKVQGRRGEGRDWKGRGSVEQTSKPRLFWMMMKDHYTLV